MKLSFILLGLTHAESFGTVKSNSAEVKVKSSNVEPNRADQSDQVKMLEARAEQGCPHARKQLDDMAAKSAKINIKPKTPDPQLAELEARAASGCPHAKELLAKMKSGTGMKVFFFEKSTKYFQQLKKKSKAGAAARGRIEFRKMSRVKRGRRKSLVNWQSPMTRSRISAIMTRF